MSLMSQDEINLLTNDSKYKNYSSSIEKALKNFESSSEWADLISSLGKLKKVLLACPKYSHIPKRISICKRLAQCLHPALPSGVHLKALEVYKVLFENIGQENLSKDLFLYANGLFPLLANAALSVKPVLLQLYEQFFLPLKQALRPCLTGLIIGLLPGLEEGSDFYSRTFNLLKNICIAQSDNNNNNSSKKDNLDNISISSNSTTSTTLTTASQYNQLAEDKYFYTCLWSAIVAQSSIRFPAIQFILTNYENKKKSMTSVSINQSNSTNSISTNINSNSNEMDDQLYLIGNSIDLMINAICCCLQDSNSLVQRSILDLICICLPTNSRQITKGDKLQLIIVAIHVVLRRDMSLNRRIYSWLMGTANTASTNTNTSSANSTTNSSNSISTTPVSTPLDLPENPNLINLNNYIEENYFNVHSKHLLIQSIKMLLNKKESSMILYLQNEDSMNLFNQSSSANHHHQNLIGSSSNTQTLTQTSANTSATLKILKIVSNLVERQEIGQAIIDDILLDLLFYVFKECNTLALNSGGNISLMKKLATSSSHHFHHSNLSQTQIQQQYLKELNELKKATSNFIFQSFQLYFIWNFCANKFEQICKQSITNDSSTSSSTTITNYNSNNQSDYENISPSQLCDLYEFILDLLTNSEIYNEIQTEFLPLMLKRIIQTLDTYCPLMSNQNLSKSLMLCLKILNKVVPKVVVPDTKPTENSHQSNKNANINSHGKPGLSTTAQKVDNQSNNSNNNTIGIDNSIINNNKTSKQISVQSTNSTTAKRDEIEDLMIKYKTISFSESHTENNNDNLSETVIVESILTDMVNIIEIASYNNNNDINKLESSTSSSLSEEISSKDLNKPSSNNNILQINLTNNNNNFNNNSNNNDLTIENCVFYLKKLTHTFVKSHLLVNSSQQEEKITKSFSSLFYSNQLKSLLFSLNDDGYLCEDLEDCLNYLNCQPQSQQNNQKSPPKLDQNQQPKISNNNNNVYSIELKPESTQYLQSFQILNKFLIKMFFFPRESPQSTPVTPSTSNENFQKTDNPLTNNETSSKSSSPVKTVIVDHQDEINFKTNDFQRQNLKSILTEITKLIDSFEFWLKDLFIISCTSKMINNNFNNKLFEYQSITLNTLIELINLSESVNSHYENITPISNNSSANPANQNSLTRSRNESSSKLSHYFYSNFQFNRNNFLLVDKPSKNVCLIQTILTKKQIDFIFHRSQFGTLTANMLWSHLTSFNPNTNNSNSFESISSLISSCNQNGAMDKKAAVLFCLLHETLPNNLCEDIIANHLVNNINDINNYQLGTSNDKLTSCSTTISNQMDGLKRFMRLWHWSRELNTPNKISSSLATSSSLNNLSSLSSQSTSHSTNEDMFDASNLYSSLGKMGKFSKTFERTLLIILDILSNKMTPLYMTKQIQEWLISCICDYNDLPRLLDILLVSLLHPTTARVSIQHFLPNVITTTTAQSSSSQSNHLFNALPFGQSLNDEENTNNNNNIDDYESKVYAISNEGGNVKYHVNQNEQQQINTNNTSNKQLFLLQSDQNAKPLRNPNVELPLSILNAASLANQGQNLNLRINPFLASKPTNGGTNSTNSASNSNRQSANEYINFEVGDFADGDDYDQTDNQSKNARLLENYKAIKAGQLMLMKNNNQSNSPSQSVSPNNQQQQAPSILVNNNNNSNNNGSYQNNLVEFCNLDDSDEENEEDEDDEDDYTNEYDHDDFYDTKTSNNSNTTANKANSINNITGSSSENDSLITSQNSSANLSPTTKKQLKLISKLKMSTSKSLLGKEISKLNNKNVKQTNSVHTSPILNKKNSSSCTDVMKEHSQSTTTNSVSSQQQSNLTTPNNMDKPIHSVATSPTITLLNNNNNNNNQKQQEIKEKRELIVDSLNPIDPNYSHMLIYINCNNIQSHFIPSSQKLVVSSSFTNSSYDHVRILFVLRCIEQMLSRCTKEFLNSITQTYLTNNANQQQSFSVYNEKLLDLIMRHLKSIYGHSFYSSSSNSNQFDLNKLNFNLNQTTYIEAISLILLFYIRSYYPPSKFSILSSLASPSQPLTKSLSNSSLNKTASSNSSPSNESKQNHHQHNQSPHIFTKQQSSSLAEELSNRNDDLFNENRNVQIYSLQILSQMIKELANMCQITSQNKIMAGTSSILSTNVVFYQSISDLLERVKLQKTLLHCFYSTVFNPSQHTLAQCVLSPNVIQMKSTNDSNIFLHNLTQTEINSKKQIQFTYVCELMKSLEHMIELEHLLNDFIFFNKLNRSNSMTQLSSSRLVNTGGLTTDSNQNEDDLLLTLSKKATHSVKLNNKLGVNSSTTNMNNSNNPTSINLNSLQSTRYIQSQTICNQSMFISTILFYLKHINLVEYHLPILKLIRNTLPSSGSALKSISTYVIEQLCRNLLYITVGNSLGGSSSSSGSFFGGAGNYILPIIAYMSSVSGSINIPDFLISILKQLSYFLHYCLLNFHTSLSYSPILNDYITSNNSLANNEMASKLYKQFQLENEVNQSQARECIINLLPSIISSMTQVWQRCNILLNSASSISVVFENQTTQQQQQQSQNNNYSWILGHPLTIKQCITDMLNPIAQHHGTQFMIAIANVWGEKRKRSKLNQEHKIIIELIRSLKSFPIPVIVQNVTDILKQSNQNNNKEKKKTPLSVWLLQFLHSYLEYHASSISSKTRQNDSLIITNELASCLCNFFKESLSASTNSNFAPACYFQLFRILHDSVNNFPILVDDKKYSKDIQESTHKLFELCNSIVASSLQQTTWLRKNYAVKLVPSQSGPSINNTSSSSSNQASNSSSFNTLSSYPTNTSTHNQNNTTASNLSASAGLSSLNGSNQNEIGTSQNHPNTLLMASSGLAKSNSNNLNDPKSPTNFSDMENELTSNLSDTGVNLNSIDQLNIDLNDANNNLTYSLQALNILAEYLAKTLDIVYKSDEKDRLVVPLLMNLMSNLWPYLKTHSAANKNNFRSASHLLMTLTAYPYTRKTWKKEVFEMLFEGQFFHVDSATLEYSKTIIDNLISNDRSMFKDVLIRVTYQQSGGLFTSKEQETEQKAQLLKRLAFVIFSSEKDQYQKNMPEIQECIAHVLRLVQSANLYSTLFLLFRILLLRISGRHLIALWPTILTELILILTQIEQDLSEELEMMKTNSKTSFIDHLTSTNYSFQSFNNTQKLPVYLSACKLIDLILTLPSYITAQFQLYKWSFVNTNDAINLKQKDQFIPYITRINNLIKLKYSDYKTQPIKTTTIGPLIRQRQIQSLVELKPFFEIITTHSFVHSSNQNQMQQQSNSNQQLTILKLFESTVHEDFLDGWTQ